jgi:tRNA pseudouridine55 synthase
VSADRLEARAWLVDKPAGPTSHDIVREIRRRLPRGTKVGHAGTLDPFATGLLVILVGRATRLADRISARAKTYRTTVRLGARSVTGDPEGPITPGGPIPGRPAVLAALDAIATRTSQRVPLYSAVRVDGQRLYEHARRGEEVATPEREMRILGLELVEFRPAAAELTLELEVTKGTYVRQVAVDLGELLGCGAYCQALRRTAVGRLRVDDAVAPDMVPYTEPVPLTSLLADMPTLVAAPADAQALVHGRRVDFAAEPGELAVFSDRGELVAITASDGEQLRPLSVFIDPEQL